MKNIEEIRKKYRGAIIEEGAEVRAGAIIEEGAEVRAGAVIKTWAIIKSGAVIRARATIGVRAVIRAGAEVDSCLSAAGLYRHQVTAYIDLRDGISYIHLGCFCRTVEEWETDFDNNPEEFPIGSPQWKERKYALRVAIEWLKRRKVK